MGERKAGGRSTLPAGAIQPRISIVTACYNSTPFIDRIYRSLAGQTYRHFEWICVDDCSVDDTIERLSRLAAPGDHGMKLFRLPQNTGGPVALAVGTQQAEGDIIVWLDHDDELFPTALDEIRASWPMAVRDPRSCGTFHRAVDPLDGSLVGGPLVPGSRFTLSKLTNVHPAVSDGTFAFKADMIRKFATAETMEGVVLNGALLLDMTARHPFVIAAGPPVRYYHRDNPESQTRKERLSRKTVHSYARIIDSADRYFLLRPARWAWHIANMLRYSKQVHGVWFEAMKSIERPLIRALAYALWPLGWLALKRTRVAANILDIAYFRPGTDRDLPNLWRGRQ